MYGPLKTGNGQGTGANGLHGYGPYDTSNDNGYGPDMDTPPPTSQAAASQIIALAPPNNEFWVPKGSVPPPPSVNPVAVLALIVGGLFAFGVGARA